MPRQIADVIRRIENELPDPLPPEMATHLTAFRAEIEILKRSGSYTPPEANVAGLWDRLSTLLYRYLPNPEGYPWAAAISEIVLSPGLKE